MSDFLSEVDKELRNDRMKALWQKIGPLVIGAAILLVLATAGYKGWVYWNETKAAESGAVMNAALADVEAGSLDDAQAKLDELTQTGFGKYPALAKMVKASTLLEKGDAQAAADAFKALSSDTSIPLNLRDFAGVRSAMIAVDLTPYDAFKADTSSIADGSSSWRHLVRELLALSAWKAGNLDEAAKWVSDMKNDAETPQSITQRIDVLEGLIISKGGALSTDDK